MTQKELGYVELEWTCPVCKTRNPGTQSTCSGCGAAQPENVTFETPVQADLTEDKEKVERAKAGPDIHCAFCGARNASTAKVCRQCGADLTQGKARESGSVVGAYAPNTGAMVRCASCGMDNPASARQCVRCGAPLGKDIIAPPPPAATPQPMPASGGKMGMIIFAVVAVLIVVGAGWFLTSLFRTSDTIASVVDARWERSIAIMGPVPVRANGWRDEVPAGAAQLSCRQEVRSTSDSPQPGASEVCGTPYTLDTGTGMGRVVQDCEYQVYDDYCSYMTTQWGVIDTVVSSGVGLAPQWPGATVASGQELGQRTERYVCVVQVDGKRYDFPLRTVDAYERCEPGSQWSISVNGLGDVVEARRVE